MVSRGNSVSAEYYLVSVLLHDDHSQLESLHTDWQELCLVEGSISMATCFCVRLVLSLQSLCIFPSDSKSSYTSKQYLHSVFSYTEAYEI